jgi:hypothetical protein
VSSSRARVRVRDGDESSRNHARDVHVSSSRARVRDGDDVPYPFVVICFVENIRFI